MRSLKRCYPPQQQLGRLSLPAHIELGVESEIFRLSD